VVVDTCWGSHGWVYTQGTATCSRHTGRLSWCSFLIESWLWSLYWSLLFNVFPCSNAGKNEFQGILLEPKNGEWSPPCSFWRKGLEMLSNYLIITRGWLLGRRRDCVLCPGSTYSLSFFLAYIVWVILYILNFKY
jgi:hypothetical protein